MAAKTVDQKKATAAGAPAAGSQDGTSVPAIAAAGSQDEGASGSPTVAETQSSANQAATDRRPFKTACMVRVGGRFIEPGSVVELTRAEFEQLKAAGALEQHED